MGRIRLLIADDDRVIRGALVDLFRAHADIEVVGQASSADDAAGLAATLQPDVAVVDVRMPGGGPAATRGILEVAPASRVVAFSAYDDRPTVIEMLTAGACGYLTKGGPAEEIAEAIRRAVRGQASLTMEMLSMLVGDLLQDVSERVATEEALRSSEERLRALLDSAPDALVVVDGRGRIALLNEQAEQMFGLQRGELLGQPVETLLPQRARERHVEHRTEYLADPMTRPMGAGLRPAGRRADGAEFPVEVTLASTQTPDGPLVTALIRDVTERVQAEEALRRSEERFRALLESAPDAAVVTDADGLIVLVNAHTERLFGYAREDLIGKHVETLLPERFRTSHVGNRHGYLSDPRTRPMGAGLDLAGRRADGDEFPADISLSAISTQDGMLLAAFVRDLTERER